ncbi:MAG: hypothetical protein E7046_02245 [Lentisphaerae bacterium]|nr:hypothetical protein [Lentisphaerota bacterium]
MFVAFDHRAKCTINLCRPSGILIPEHLQILDVDNNETICENTRPTLSSVAPDFERCGYEAAAALHALFKRRTSTAKELKSRSRKRSKGCRRRTSRIPQAESSEPATTYVPMHSRQSRQFPLRPLSAAACAFWR